MNLVQSPVISVSNLHKRFNLEAGFFARLGRYVYAVNGVSFSIGRNETYGLVGESGCGKTTTARLLVRMYEADEGDIFYRDWGEETAGSDNTGSDNAGTGENSADNNTLNVRKLKGRDLRRYREKVKYVFQDPARSLNPRMTVHEVLTSGARWSLGKKGKTDKSLREEAASLLEEVGLSADDLDRKPAEFSGGQRQRISIARGLVMKPGLLICDEVVSALDVSIQGQILNLLIDLKTRRDLSFLFIAHDLKVACYFCDRIGVMYRGEIMEEAAAMELWKTPLHPYTELLFSSAGDGGRCGGQSPAQRGVGRDAVRPRGEASPLQGAASGMPEIESCAFSARCPYAEGLCFSAKPPMREAAPGHFVRCHRAEGKLNPQG